MGLQLQQAFLQEINHEYSLEGLMLKLKPQYFGHLMQRAQLIGKIDAEEEAPILWSPGGKTQLEKTLLLGKIEERRRRGQQRMRWLDGITDSMDMSLSMY